MSIHNMIEGDPLWVPLLTHYDDSGEIDHARMTAHLHQVSGDVRQILLAGSTGDGWELDDGRFQNLIDFAVDNANGNLRIMFGTLASDSASVVSRMRMVEDRIGREPELRQRYVGATVCAPVDPQANQNDIIVHFQEVMKQTSSPISVYQLPQITGCSMAPETVQRIANDPRVVMFKDSSGIDEVAASGRDFGMVVMLRGAEGGYVESVTGGGYGGWLLSTANVFGASLRQIETTLRSGKDDEAEKLSVHLSQVVSELFAAAGKEGGANAFSNANRAADHLRAYGKRWREAPLPFKQDGRAMSSDLIEKAAAICESVIALDKIGYLDR